MERNRDRETRETEREREEGERGVSVRPESTDRKVYAKEQA
jgi:hypothetical protein